MGRRLVAALLAACLAFSPGAGFLTPVYAAEEKSPQAQTASGSVLEVKVADACLFPFEGRVTVEVKGPDGKSQKQELDGTNNSALARFSVAQGDYVVTVSAKKYAAYTQTVQIQEGWTHRIMVCSLEMETETGAKLGWIRLGDVNGDQLVDATDSKELLSAIRSGASDAKYDLNQDGKVDIADLNLLTKSLDRAQESSVEKLWVPDAKNVKAAEGTILEGDCSDLFWPENFIQLSTKNNEVISADHPVEAEFTLARGSLAAPVLGGMAIHAPADPGKSGNTECQITNGEVVLVYEDGNEERTQTISLDPNKKKLAAMSSVRAGASVSTEAGGVLVLDFGGQIAVKKVSIRITGTKKTQPLVEIAQVEFVNDMENRIPEPSLDIPSITAVKPGDKKLTVSWSAQPNVTGYEVYIAGPVKNQEADETQIIPVSETTCDISSINNKNLVNYKEYTLKVRSVNGDWTSPWSEAGKGKPVPQKKPAAPDHVKAVGGYRSVTVSWKAMDDSDGYMVYYKESDAKDYQPAVRSFTQTQEGTGRLSANSYTITGLKDHTAYSVYVISWNELGWGEKSLASTAVTKTDAVPVLPSYKLLNTPKGAGELTEHIVGASIGVIGNAASGSMVASPLDDQTSSYTALGLVDNDYASYWQKADWDDGVAYAASNKGMSVTLDGDYQINYFTFAAADQTVGVNRVTIAYWDSKEPDKAKSVAAQLLEKKDKNDNPYYIVKFNETVTANKIYMCLGRSYTSYVPMKVGEIHFHWYDSLEDDIMGLYANEMHTTLKDDVTEQKIQELENRLETADEASGEKHPLYQELALELKTAREILNSQLEPEYQVDNRITAAKDGHLGFGGLNAWQPLGRAAKAGETLLVYVGCNTKRTGEAANLQLVFTQHHAESSALASTMGLKVGRNMITVPQISDKEFERGGQIYVAYTGNNSSEQYAVRISGGGSIPVLNVYKKSENERKEAIRSYIQKLEEHEKTIQQLHGQLHLGQIGVKDDYDAQNCILNATDIMMESMMYSLPATRIMDGIGRELSLDKKVEKLDQALRAMEDTMTLFYQHKGLSSEAGTGNGNNALPAQHLNIRYMRMFAGAFMYAAGNHIGIEWGSANVASAPADWNGFGWGIAHEIGHDINQGTYAVAEVTNNYFAQLLTGTQRYTYDNVYKKVTSGTTGRASNVFTQLAMYWQLHLAFDSNTDDRHIYSDYKQQFDNLFFARVDTYSRNPGKAPQKGLRLDGGTDQNLMRLACAAADKNILPFFERWGMVPDQDTVSYAAKYGEPDQKALYYVNEDARDYRAKQTGEAGTILGKEAVTAAVQADSNKVTVTISTNQDKDLILGYEIIRTMTSNGAAKSKVAGFVPVETAEATKFVDTIYAVNNRVISYEVRAVDKYLNYSLAASAGSVKIETDGILDKSEWTVETNMTSDDDRAVEKDEEDPDSGYEQGGPQNVAQTTVNSIERVIDNKTDGDGIYTGKISGEAVITIDMHKSEQVTALKYSGDALPLVTIKVSTDGKKFTTVKKDYDGLSRTGEGMIWFNAVKESEQDDWIGTYDARYVQISFAKEGSVQIKEIDLCGPSGDNLEFLTADGADQKLPAVGVLSEDYQYAEGEGHTIPKGSLVFTGTYKGNPAYNVVMLYDTSGNVIGSGSDGKVQAEQVIFASVPEKGNLGETSSGTWIYYVEKGHWEEAIASVTGVRGELYRVDDAKTLEGERIVSDTMIITLPETLPQIQLTGSGLNQ